jgi:hypothetical protein
MQRLMLALLAGAALAVTGLRAEEKKGDGKFDGSDRA